MAVVLLVLNAQAARADEWISLSVPLRDGRFYSVADFQRQYREKFGGQLTPVDGGREAELTPIERATLLVADEAQLIRVRLEPDRLTLWIPNPQDDAVRKRNRHRLEGLLGVSLSDWPAEKGLHLPKKFDPTRRTILLIHGFESDASATRRFSDACDHQGIQTLVFDYPATGPLAWDGDRLSADLKSLAIQHPELQLVIVAHSMGGLVARYCLETPGKNPGCVSDLFMLGTPNAGTHLAAAHEWLEVIYALVPGLGLSPSLIDGLGEASDDLLPGSEFFKTLDGRQRTPTVRYHTAIGRKSFVTESQRHELVRELGAFFDQHGTGKRTRAEVLGYLQSEELQNGRGDGVVSVASAKLPGAVGEKVFDLNHVELFSLPGERPDEGATFRWVLQSMHWDQRSRRP